MTEQAAVAPQASLAKFAALLLAAFCLPPLLIAFGLIPFDDRFVVLVAVAAALAVLAWQQGIPLRDLGLRTDNLKPALVVNASLSLVLGAALLAAYGLGFMRQPRAVDWWWFAPFYVLVSCPAQEFACRGFLFAEMSRRGITGSGAQIAISAFTYAFLHIVYKDWAAFLAPLAIGIAWGAIYRRYPNLWGVLVSHAILGLISIMIGLV
jgi:CAAX protease family protein